MRPLTPKLMNRFRSIRDMSRLARKVRSERLTYLGREKIARLERELGRVNSKAVPGDFVEFGVVLGGSAAIIAAQARKRDRRFCGFDVFEMIPEPRSEKDDDQSRKRFEVISAGKSTGIGGDTYYGYIDGLYDRVAETLARHGTPLKEGRVELHKGLFEHTLPGAGIDRIAFAHLDCDWYDPVSLCLNFVAPRLSPGG